MEQISEPEVTSPESVEPGSQRGCLGTVGMAFLWIFALGIFMIAAPLVYVYCVAQAERQRLTDEGPKPWLRKASIGAGVATVLLGSVAIQNAWWALFGGEPADGAPGLGALVGAVVGALLLVGLHQVALIWAPLRSDQGLAPKTD